MVDRGLEQPDHPHRRRLQRPVRGRPGRARLDDQRPVHGRGRRRAAGRRRPARRRRAAGRGRRAAAPDAAPPPRCSAPTWCARATRSPGLAANAGVAMEQMAAANGLDPSAPLLTGTVLKLPSGAPTPARASEPLPSQRVVPAAGPAPTPTRLGAGDIQSVASPARRLAVARRRDRVAGERLQQRDGLLGQRPRRHAGDARHVGLRREQPRRAQARHQLGDRQRPRRRALPPAPARADRRRRGRRDRRLLPGPRLRPRRAACSTTRRSTSRTSRRCARASGAEDSGPRGAPRDVVGRVVLGARGPSSAAPDPAAARRARAGARSTPRRAPGPRVAVVRRSRLVVLGLGSLVVVLVVGWSSGRRPRMSRPTAGRPAACRRRPRRSGRRRSAAAGRRGSLRSRPSPMQDHAACRRTIRDDAALACSAASRRGGRGRSRGGRDLLAPRRPARRARAARRCRPGSCPV